MGFQAVTVSSASRGFKAVTVSSASRGFGLSRSRPLLGVLGCSSLLDRSAQILEHKHP